MRANAPLRTRFVGLEETSTTDAIREVNENQVVRRKLKGNSGGRADEPSVALWDGTSTSAPSFMCALLKEPIQRVHLLSETEGC